MAAAKGREDSARAAGREYAERARRAETLHEETEAELAEVGAAVHTRQAVLDAGGSVSLVGYSWQCSTVIVERAAAAGVPLVHLASVSSNGS